MWTCAYCNETTDDDSWEVCWKCNTSRAASPEDARITKERTDQLRKQFQDCLRCGTRMRYAGTRDFRQGGRWGVNGDLGGLFGNKESYVAFSCPRCGKIEFYLDGIGNELRGDPAGESADLTDQGEPWQAPPPPAGDGTGQFEI